MGGFSIRFAEQNDAQEILDIYAFYIRETAITFECEVPDIAGFKQRMRDIKEVYPYLICRNDKKIVGYAYAHRQMERAAYNWNAELSVYIDKDFYGLGVGTALYGTLLEILTFQNVRNVYGIVTSPNIGSERLHAHFGFTPAGTYHKTGFKCDKWHDVMLYEKRLQYSSNFPDDLIPIKQLDQKLIDNILHKANQHAQLL